jgi:hypothetical protein
MSSVVADNAKTFRMWRRIYKKRVEMVSHFSGALNNTMRYVNRFRLKSDSCIYLPHFTCTAYLHYLLLHRLNFLYREREFQTETSKSGRSIKRNHVTPAEREGSYTLSRDDEIPYFFSPLSSISCAAFWPYERLK